MSKSRYEIVREIARKHGKDYADVSQIVNEFIDLTKKEISQGGKVEIRGFGTFELKAKRSKLVHDFRSNTKFSIPERKVPSFRVAKAFKEAVV